MCCPVLTLCCGMRLWPCCVLQAELQAMMSEVEGAAAADKEKLLQQHAASDKGEQQGHMGFAGCNLRAGCGVGGAGMCLREPLSSKSSGAPLSLF